MSQPNPKVNQSMDARIKYLLAILTSLTASQSVAQQMPGLAVGSNQRFAYQTRNFVAYADSQQVAQQVALTAERYRKKLAEVWLGKTLPNWRKRCPIRVRVGTIGAGGATTFRFVGGGVTDWKMKVQGSLERVLDSVIPHEVNHTIFASHFRRPIPRWADEGAATLFEHESERNRQLRLLDQMQRMGRRYTLRQLMSMMEYPKEMQQVLTLYAQGYSLVDFLIQQGGRREFIRFLEDAGRTNWETAIRKRYAHNGVESLDENWNGWFLAGSPKLATPGELSLDELKVVVARQTQTELPEPGRLPKSVLAEAGVIRGQSPPKSARATPTFVQRPEARAAVIAPEPLPPYPPARR